MRSSIRGGRSSRRPFASIKASRNLASSQPISSRCFPPLWKYFRLLERWRLQGSYDFGRHHRLLDIAGGTGSFLIAVLHHHNALKGTLFELPGACAVARQRFANEPERSRIDVIEGDVFKDTLPLS